MTPLDQLRLVDGHIVPEVVKAQLVVGAVGNVGGVAFPPLRRGHGGDNEAHAQPHIPVDLAHPLGVTLGKVLIDGDHMDTPARQGIEVTGQNRNQRLTFAGLHFRDAALVQNDAADDLHRIGLHAQHTPGGLPNGGKGLRKQLVQGLALGVTGLEKGGLTLQFLLGKLGVAFLQRKNFIYCGLNFLQLPLRTGAEKLGNQSHRNLPCQMVMVK